MHSGAIVSYAILRPPSPNAVSRLNSSDRLPVLMNLHGAGLEADSDQVRHSLDVLPDLGAWTLFPTGVTPWSADDWRESLVNALKILLTENRYMGIRGRRSCDNSYPSMGCCRWLGRSVCGYR